jgi:hypothetical protein
MDKHNVRNIFNSLSGTHNVTMTNLHAAQCEACKGLEPAEAVEVILQLQRIAAKVDRAFSSDLHQLDQLLTDW